LKVITLKPARRLGEIAKELRVATKDVRRPVQTLLDEKKVKTTGQRGGTRYFPGGGAKKNAAKKPTGKRKAKKGAKRKTAAAT
jgi:predicted transcriptional regulator